MPEEWKDLDGAARNIDKFKKEYAKLVKEMKPHWARFFKRPFDGHSYINLFVEARRTSPYLTGHIDAVLYPSLSLLLIYILV